MKILIASPINPTTINALQNDHEVVNAFGEKTEVLKELIEGCEVLIFRSGVQISAELMQSSPKLKLLIRAGSGLDNLDIDYVQRHGLELIRIPEPGAKAVAEMTFALMLALSRNLLEADRSMRQAQWVKHKLGGYLLTGKVLGIIGAGNIGSRVGKMGVAWDMKVIANDTETSVAFTTKRAEEGIRLTTFDEVITTADFISIHVPLDDTTHYLINESALSRMKPGVILVNIARGGVVNEQALYKALTEGNKLRGAALDVHEQEGEGKLSLLADLPNVILTPHIGAMTFDSQEEIGQRIEEIISSYIAR